MSEPATMSSSRGKTLQAIASSTAAAASDFPMCMLLDESDISCTFPTDVSSFSSTYSLLTTKSNNKRNPSDYLPAEVICRITSFLDHQSLMAMETTCHYYHNLCRQNRAGWEILCHNMWKDKIHVLPQAQQLLRQSQQQQQTDNHDDETTQTSARQAFKMAWLDARERNHILPEEFCFDPENNNNNSINNNTIWSFRFKQSAGADWTSVDPWYQGLPCRRMVFLRDGSVKQYLPNEETLEQDAWANHQLLVNRNSSNESFVSSMRGRPITRLPHGAGVLVDPPVTMSWRFLTRPLDLPNRQSGSYVRFTVAGRDVPTYSIRRSPTKNWGFIMESCWGLYASFPLPPRRRRLLRRTPSGHNRWVDENHDYVASLSTTTTTTTSSDSDGMNESNHAAAAAEVLDPLILLNDQSCEEMQERRRKSRRIEQQRQLDNLLADDTSLSITNEIQWREAFLYNVGARVLPEGDEAANQFDQAWAGV